MDRRALVAALLAAGLPPESFTVAGVHEHASTPTDFWFLRPAPGGGWQVGSFERGRDDVRAVLDSEAAACEQLYRALTGRSAEH